MRRRVRFCGVDLGSDSLHLVCLAEPAALGEPASMHAAVGSSPGPWVDRCPEAQALGVALSAVGQELGLILRNAPTAVSLPTSSLVTRSVSLPPLTPREQRAALYLELDRMAGIVPEETVGDWLPLAIPRDGKGETEGQVHLLLTARQSGVNAVGCALRAAHLRPAAVEPEPATLFRLAQLLAKPEEGEAEVLVDLGASATRLLVIQRDELLLFREVSVGGTHLTQALASQLGVAVAEAEVLKRTEYQEGVWPDLFGTVSVRLVSEVERSLRYIEHRFGLDGYGALHLVGGGARWPFLRGVMEAAVGRQAEGKVVLPVGETDPALATATALALWQEQDKIRQEAGGGLGR